jgi:Protein of unknown function (DUF3303)
MLFMITYTFGCDHRNAAQARFRATGGLPGEGAKMLGRWHNVGGQRGFVLAESSDAIALAKWLQEWTDLLSFEVIPVNNDEDTMKVLGA